jgi:hypothetical protein
MARNGTTFDFRRSFSDRDGIDDPALRVPEDAGVPRAADSPTFHWLHISPRWGADSFHRLARIMNTTF